MDTLEKNINSHIEELMCGFSCPKDFQCYRTGFKNLCKARDIGLESLANEFGLEKLVDTLARMSKSKKE